MQNYKNNYNHNKTTNTLIYVLPKSLLPHVQHNTLHVFYLNNTLGDLTPTNRNSEKIQWSVGARKVVSQNRHPGAEDVTALATFEVADVSHWP